MSCHNVVQMELDCDELWWIATEKELKTLDLVSVCKPRSAAYKAIHLYLIEPNPATKPF